jgi:DNA-binding transcriptional LysR family regulator
VEGPVNSMEDIDHNDFVIAPRPFGERFGKRLEHTKLWRDEMTCIASKSDTRWGATITAADFRAARHVAYQAGARTPPSLASLIQPTSSLEVRPVCTVSNFLVLGSIVEQSNCLALVPRMLAIELCKRYEIRTVELTYPRKRLDVDIFWTASRRGRRGHGWARDEISRIGSKFDASR